MESTIKTEKLNGIETDSFNESKNLITNPEAEDSDENVFDTEGDNLDLGFPFSGEEPFMDIDNQLNYVE